MARIQWEIKEHRGETVLSLWIGHACIYARELEARTASERELEARRIQDEFARAPIVDLIEDEDEST